MNSSRPSRTERKAAAEVRRRDWRIRWVDLGQQMQRQGEGKPVREALIAVANDAADLARRNPQQQSEVMRAMDEFLTTLRTVMAQVTSQEPPISRRPHSADGKLNGAFNHVQSH